MPDECHSARTQLSTLGGLLFFQPDLVVAASLVVLEAEQAAALGVFDEVREALVAVVRLVEARMYAADRLLDLRAPQ